MQRGGQDFYYHADDIYNVVALTDASGSVVERYQYEDFGEPMFFDAIGSPLGQSLVSNKYLFTGRRYDPETELYYYRTRYLDSLAGRFTSRDTIGVWKDSLALGSGFAYVGNNPSSRIDALGLACKPVVDRYKRRELSWRKDGPTPFTSQLITLPDSRCRSKVAYYYLHKGSALIIETVVKVTYWEPTEPCDRCPPPKEDIEDIDVDLKDYHEELEFWSCVRDTIA